jgi:predicted RNA-binding Zn-ribbon protein involved in translation (DUF1610 family)
MSQQNAEPCLNDAATLVITSEDLASGKATLEAELALHVCAQCQAELPDRYHFDCPECGHARAPVSRCRTCSGSLRQELVRYVAHGGNGGTATQLLPGVTCLNCGVSGVEDQQLADLDELADAAPHALFFLPEAGIYTSEQLEVLVDAEVSGPGEPDEVIKGQNGMSLRVGSASPLFEMALSVVTEQEPGDIFSPTLQVTPGPPYTAEQRRDFHLLLAQIQRELGSAVSCWSASVGLSEEAPIDPILTEQLMAWEADRDGAALALYHAIVTDHAPGRFLNSVRLLELVLQRGLEDEVVRARRDASLGDADFAQLVHTFSADPTTRLRRAIQSRGSAALPILQRLWQAMHPGRSFDEAQVYAAIVAFPESYRASLSAPPYLGLPWETPDFDGYAQQLRRLISAILDG